MATKDDPKATKKQVEALLDLKLGEEALQLIQLRHPVALSTRMPSVTTHKNILINRFNTCFNNNCLDVNGFSITGNNGQSVFRLTQFICPHGERYEHPISVVATPFSSKPFFLTVLHSLINNNTDVEIRIFAWDPNGNPAAGVPVNWRCRVELPIIIL